MHRSFLSCNKTQGFDLIFALIDAYETVSLGTPFMICCSVAEHVSFSFEMCFRPETNAIATLIQNRVNITPTCRPFLVSFLMNMKSRRRVTVWKVKINQTCNFVFKKAYFDFVCFPRFTILNKRRQIFIKKWEKQWERDKIQIVLWKEAKWNVCLT